jgi:hypothetical protein
MKLSKSLVIATRYWPHFIKLNKLHQRFRNLDLIIWLRRKIVGERCCGKMLDHAVVVCLYPIQNRRGRSGIQRREE